MDQMLFTRVIVLNLIVEDRVLAVEPQAVVTTEVMVVLLLILRLLVFGTWTMPMAVLAVQVYQERLMVEIG